MRLQGKISAKVMSALKFVEMKKKKIDVIVKEITILLGAEASNE